MGAVVRLFGGTLYCYDLFDMQCLCCTTQHINFMNA